MERRTCEPGPRDRLGATMGLLDPQSRQLVELWLAGLGRRQIAAELRIGEDAAGVLGEAAIHRLRRLLGGS